MKIGKIVKIILMVVVGLIVGAVMALYLIANNSQKLSEKYPYHGSDGGDPIVILEKKVDLKITNYMYMKEWIYWEEGVVVLDLVDGSNYFQLLKIECTYADYSNIFSLPFDVNRQVIDQKDRYAYRSLEKRMNGHYFYRIKYIVDQTKRDVKSIAFHGKILDIFQENTDKYQIRLFYSEVQQIGLLEKPGKYKTALMIFKFDLTDDFIPTDIAFIEDKADPKHLYIVIAVDRNIGENHATVRKFIKSYFNISVG